MHPSAEAIGLAPALAVGVALHSSRRRRPRACGSPPERSASRSSSPPSSPQLEPLANHTFLWAHLLQNVVLAEWAPALLVLAIPPQVAERAAGFPLFRPFVALPLWLVAYYTWHLPWIYDAALRQPALAAPSRAPHVSRRRRLRLVAGRPRQALGGREGRLPLRRLRPLVPARPAARADPARDLSVLRPRPAHLGPEPARRPADRGRDDGGRGGDRLLRGVRRLPAALPRGRAGGRSVQPEPERVGASSRLSAGRPSRSSRLRSASALISAPSSSAIAASQSQVSMMITAASDPHVLL